MLERTKNCGINGELWKTEFWKTLGITGKQNCETIEIYIENRKLWERIENCERDGEFWKRIENSGRGREL